MPMVLCFGDSNTYGQRPAAEERKSLRYPRHLRWPGVLGEALGGAWTVLEEGLSGRTTVRDDPQEGKHKNGLRYLPACVESHSPLDVVILMLGTNDLKARFAVQAEDIAEGMARLVQVIRALAFNAAGKPPQILLLSPACLGDELGERDAIFAFGRLQSLRLAAAYERVAGRMGCHFLDAGSLVTVDPADGVHLSAAAHQRLGLAVAQCLRSMAL